MPAKVANSKKPVLSKKTVSSNHELTNDEFIDKLDKMFFPISRCGRCENTMKECICYSYLATNLDAKIDNLKEELKDAKEIIKSHKPVEDEANKEINRLKAEIYGLKATIEARDNSIKTICEERSTLYDEIQYLKDENKKIKTEKDIAIDLLYHSQFVKYKERVIELEI